jgi:cytoskeletal protein RodZ
MQEEVIGVFGAAAALRESRGVDLECIARATKINTRYLRAIESADFQVLPGGVYDTSFITQYARAIEFDEQKLLAAYRKVQGPPEFGAEPEPPDRLTLAVFLKRLSGFFSGAFAR